MWVIKLDTAIWYTSSGQEAFQKKIDKCQTCSDKKLKDSKLIILHIRIIHIFVFEVTLSRSSSRKSQSCRMSCIWTGGQTGDSDRSRHRWHSGGSWARAPTRRGARSSCTGWGSPRWGPGRWGWCWTPGRHSGESRSPTCTWGWSREAALSRGHQPGEER